MRRSFFFLVILLCGFIVSIGVSAFSGSTETNGFSLSGEYAKKKKKKKKKKKPAKSNCDPKSLVRTSADSVILKKYVTLYKDLGGVCYIRQLQKMGEIEKTGEGQFTVYLGKSKSPEDRIAWTTYMYCPIGKPDGSVALVQSSGDTVQYCTYKNEMKNGFMIWLKPKFGIVAAFEFINDEKPFTGIPEYGTPSEAVEEEPTNRTEE